MTTTQPIALFAENMKEVDRLIVIHETLSGTHRGRRFGMEVINKSAIVLITACWESLVEDIGEQGFEWMVRNTNKHSVIPQKVLTLASKNLKEDKDEGKIWKLAGDGWRAILQEHRQETIEKHLHTFHTPNADNVDALFRDLFGVKKISSSWFWTGMKSENARDRLREYIKLRGDIAHRVSTSKSVTKKQVQDYRDFAYRISIRTSNKIYDHLYLMTGKSPWNKWFFGSVK